MIKHVTKFFVIASLSVISHIVNAEEIQIPYINPDEGRIGEVRRVEDESEFRVCADPDNLPYSNMRLEGFEDKIAQLLADDLGKKLTFTYAYNRQGFYRNTINAMRCDVIMSTTSDNDALRTSKPYYRAGHVFVFRKDSNFNITNWDSPDLKKAYIGIVDKSPSAVPLNDYGLIGNSRPYRLQRDLNLPSGHMIDDLVNGEIDVAVMWGPIGGYFAKNAKIPLVVVPIPEYENVKGKEYWNISVAVRKKDKARMEMINAALERNMEKINKILDDFGIPHVPVIEEDSIDKLYKKSIKRAVSDKKE